MHKKIVSVLIATLMIVQMFGFSSLVYADLPSTTWQDSGAVGSAYAGGDGTEGNPYKISNGAELAYLAQQVNSGTNYAGKYFVIIGNIDLGAHLWIPIGDSTHPFTGNFNGKGHIISNMTITAAAGNQGLFGYIESGGSVTRVAMDEPSITITGSGHENVGGIAGYNEGAISDCLVRGAYNGIITTSTYAGGIAGWNQNGTIDHCVADLSVYADNSSQGLVGGVAGYNGGASGVIRDCFSLWPPASSDYSATRFVGAIVGRSAGGYVLNNHYTYEDEGDRAVVIYAVGNTGTNESTTNSYLGTYTGDVMGGWQCDDAFFLDTIDATTYWNAPWDTGEIDSIWTTDGSSAPIYLQPEDSGGGGAPTFWSGDVDTTIYVDGTGDDIEDPYVIEDAAQLAGLAKLVNEGINEFAGKYIVLGDSIDLSGYEWVPIGNADNHFSGYFDGQGNTILGMFIGDDGDSNDTLQYVGLFGYADTDSVITDVKLMGASIYSAYAASAEADGDGANIGILVGYTEGEVDQCYVSGTIVCGAADNASIFAGGLVGHGYGDDANIHDSTADVTVSADDCNDETALGGLIGWLAGGQSTLYNCSSSGEIQLGDLTDYYYAAAGGLAGKNDGAIWNCFATGQVIGGVGTYLGGFVGYANTGDIDNCYSRGDVGNAGANVGGFVGFGSGGLIQNCYATGGTTTGDTGAYVGGFNGYMDEATIQRCYFNLSATSLKDGNPVSEEDAESAGATGMVAAEMQTDAFMTLLNDNRALIEESDYNSEDMASVGFSGWIRDTENDGYPYFGEGSGGGDAPTFWSGDVDTTIYVDGTGDNIEDPYVIEDAAQLAGLAKLVNEGTNEFAGKYIVLEDSIDLSGYEWVPIGTADHPFSGHFDGGGNTISNMYIGEDGDSNNTFQFVGLFGYADDSSEIAEVTLTNASIYSAYAESADAEAGGAYIGLLVGFAQGVVEDCDVNGSIGCGDAARTNNYAGGLVGYFDGEVVNTYIQDSDADVDVSAGDCTKSAFIGGFVGGNEGAISGCTASGKVTIGGLTEYENSAAGGFVGWNQVSIDSCSASGSVTGGYAVYLGGFAGLNDRALVYNSSATGAVSGGQYAAVGGFVGRAQGGGGLGLSPWNSRIYNCYATGDATGAEAESESFDPSYVGGFAGSSANATFLNCYAAGAASGDGAYAHGFFGWVDGTYDSLPDFLSLCYYLRDASSLTGTDNYAVGYLDDEESGLNSDAFVAYDLNYNLDSSDIMADTLESTGDDDLTFSRWTRDSGENSGFPILATLSSDSSLSNMIPSTGSLSPAFASGTTAYAISVGNAVSSITITPTVNDSSATLTVNGQAAASGQASQGIPLSVGSNTIQIRVTAEDESETLYTVTVTRAAASGGGGGSTTPASDPVIVIVNGTQQNAGTETKTTEDGKTVVTVAVNNTVIESKIDDAIKNNPGGTGNVIQVPVADTKSDVAKVELTGDIVKKLEENTFDVSIKRDDVEYLIPAKEFTISKVAENLGIPESELKDITIEVKITKLDDTVAAKYAEAAKANGAELVFPPVEFEIAAKTTSADGTVSDVSISKFSNYVERIMEIPAGVDPSKITTGIVFNADGTYSHVPTDVFQKDGKWYAKLNSLTNSDYSVIWHPITVKSVENHWSKEAVNDMASRLVIFDPESFVPNQAITRADFAEYIVRALGLYREGAHDNNFRDVSADGDRTLAILIASEYGIVTGYPDGTFRPDAQITREEAMTMYQRAMKITKLTGSDQNRYQNYTDYTMVSGWAKGYVQEVLSAHVFNGNTATTISPKSNLTYAEAAQAIRNLLVESNLINK